MLFIAHRGASGREPENTLRAFERALALGGDVRGDLADLGRRVGARFLHLCWESAAPEPHTLVSADMIADLRRQGFQVVIWHEERAEELRHLVRLPVWGICTNTPDVLASVMAKRE